MDFDYNEDQRHLRDEARRFLAAHAPASAARAVLDHADRAYDETLWRRVAAQGWLGVAIPEEYGGLGLGAVELGAIAEEIGASLAPIPFGSTLYLFAEAILLGGTEAQKSALLPAIAEGGLIGCAALFEGAGDLDLDRMTTSVVGGRLRGTKQPVIDGGIADRAVVLARDDSGPALFIVDLAGDGVARAPLETIDGSVGAARLTFEDALASRLSVPVEGLLARAAVLYAFEQIGGADRCLAMTSDYVRERVAFGGPIGRFQAVKHKLADMYVTNQLARSHAYHGIWAVDRHAPVLLQAAAAARVAASDAYWFAAKEGLHLHGAIGFTWAHDAHLFYRRAHHLSLVLGSPQWWKDRLFVELAAALALEPA